MRAPGTLILPLYLTIGLVRLLAQLKFFLIDATLRAILKRLGDTGGGP